MPKCRTLEGYYAYWDGNATSKQPRRKQWNSWQHPQGDVFLFNGINHLRTYQGWHGWEWGKVSVKRTPHIASQHIPKPILRNRASKSNLSVGTYHKDPLVLPHKNLVEISMILMSDNAVTECHKILAWLFAQILDVDDQAAILPIDQLSSHDPSVQFPSSPTTGQNWESPFIRKEELTLSTLAMLRMEAASIPNHGWSSAWLLVKTHLTFYNLCW